MPLMIQTLETLVEFAQGCQENQATIFDSRAVDHVNQILRYPDFIGCSDEEVAHLKLMAGVLVLSMLEDSNVETELMAKELVGQAIKNCQINAHAGRSLGHVRNFPHYGPLLQGR